MIGKRHPKATPRRSADAVLPKSGRAGDRRSELPFAIQVLSSLAVSALGLVLVGGISLTAGAQSSIVGVSVTEGTDTTKAIPVPEPHGEAGLLNPNEPGGNPPGQPTGNLSVFGPENHPGSTELRRALDRALAGQLAQQRSVTLDQTGNSQADYSSAAMLDARDNNLQRITERQRREAARLAEEKRKAEEALRKAEEARIATQQAQAQAQAQAENLILPDTSVFGSATPQATAVVMDSGGMNDKAATPLRPGSYVFSARWGAVGSWARYHTGQDLSAPIGTPVRAAADGIVMTPNAGDWAGTHVIINHGASGSTLYAHMQQAIVRPGQMVRHGQVIGYVGMTGRTFGPHLHFEHYPAGASTTNPYVSNDPYPFMLSLGIKL